MGNVSFNEATLASVILASLPLAWRNQYDLTHSTVPESPRAMLLALENIQKLFAKKYNKKARANKAKAAAASKAGNCVPRKCSQGGNFDKGAPKKAHSAKYCCWCKAVNEPFTNHNTTECHRFEKDGTPEDRPVKPFDSAKKLWK